MRVLIIALGMLLGSCAKTDKDQGFAVLREPVCKASYDERTDVVTGRIHYRFTSYWVRCYGMVGTPRATCDWRNSD